MRVGASLIFLCSLGMSFGAYTAAQKKAYEEALKPAVYKAYLSDSYRDAVDRMFPPFVDLLVTKVLTVPPYNKNIKAIKSATPGHPVFLPYMFEAKESGTRNLLCSISVAEFKDGKEFYYIVPYRNDLSCTENSEAE